MSMVEYQTKFMDEMSQPNTLLSPEQFQEFLLQDIASLGETNWMFVLAYSVSYVPRLTTHYDSTT